MFHDLGPCLTWFLGQLAHPASVFPQLSIHCVLVILMVQDESLPDQASSASEYEESD